MESESIKDPDKITPKQAVAILKLDGFDVTEDQAKIILDFLYEIAEIVVQQYLEGED